MEGPSYPVHFVVSKSDGRTLFESDGDRLLAKESPGYTDLCIEVGGDQILLITLEDRLLRVSSRLPKLPDVVVAHLTKWAWVIALGVGILVLLDAFDIVSAATAFGGSCTGVLLGCVGGSALSSFYVAAALTAAYGVVYLRGVRPLRELRERGWRIVFLGTLVQLGAGIALTFFFGLNGITLVLLEVVCGWYLLFSIRSAFIY
ncbi:MAG: hypothetical protein ACP5HZ_11425 [Ferrimicrobium sp.]